MQSCGSLVAQYTSFRLQRSMLDTECKRFNSDSTASEESSTSRCANCGHFPSCHMLDPKTQEPALQLFSAVRNARCLTSVILALASASSKITSSRSLKDLAVAAVAIAKQVAYHGSRWKLRGKNGSPNPSMVPEACSVRLSQSYIPLVFILQSTDPVIHPASVQEVRSAIDKVAVAASTKRLPGDSAGPGAANYVAILQTCVEALILLDTGYSWLHYECTSTENIAIPGASAIPDPHVYFSLFAGPWEPMPDFQGLEPLFSRFFCTSSALPRQGADRVLNHIGNPLLQLFMARWQETELHFGATHVCPEGLVSSGLGASGPKRGGEAQTMKKGDPVCEALLARWRESIRTFACRMYAFAVPTSEAIAVLKRYSPVVEVGAGTGYWASLLRKAGADVTALDCQPTDSGHNEYHGRCKPWAKVRNSPLEAHMHGRALFLCYPPPDCKMGEGAVATFTGDTVLYVGEWSGDTGTTGLQQQLLCNWRLVEVVPLPNWGDTCYELMVWQRCEKNTQRSGRQPGAIMGNIHSLESHHAVPYTEQQAISSIAGSNSKIRTSGLVPLGVECGVCGAHGTQASPLWRCRQTCCFAFCSDECLQLALQSTSAPFKESKPAPGAGKAARVDHKPQQSSRRCSSSCRQGKWAAVVHEDSQDPHLRLGTYASELRVRHCNVDASALKLSDSRLYRQCRHGEGCTDDVHSASNVVCKGQERAGLSKAQKRKKRRKR